MRYRLTVHIVGLKLDFLGRECVTYRQKSLFHQLQLSKFIENINLLKIQIDSKLNYQKAFSFVLF